MNAYYRREHEEAYLRIEREGKSAWDDLHGGGGFDEFSGRPFLDWALTSLRLRPDETDVLEYGCGTGPAACFLAARGYRVDAIDLIPRAIGIARRLAGERGLRIDFDVQDICTLVDVQPAKVYDLIVDTYCLQSIVLDEDRRRLFAAVRARLKATGHYLLSTAMYQATRDYGEDGLFDAQTGIVYLRLDTPRRTRDMPDGATLIADGWYVPHRRHLKPDALVAELRRGGFRTVWQGGVHGGEAICVPLPR